MDNVVMTVSGDKLLIEVDLAEEGAMSASGKSTVIASTHGNIPVPDHSDMRIGLNLYRKNGHA